MKNTKSMHITPVGGNVFADLGFDPKEAAALKAESDRIISEKLAIKDSLMTELAVWIDAKKLKRMRSTNCGLLRRSYCWLNPAHANSTATGLQILPASWRQAADA